MVLIQVSTARCILFMGPELFLWCPRWKLWLSMYAQGRVQLSTCQKYKSSGQHTELLGLNPPCHWYDTERELEQLQGAVKAPRT